MYVQYEYCGKHSAREVPQYARWPTLAKRTVTLTRKAIIAKTKSILDNYRSVT